MKRVYVHPLPIRLWHWTNAAGFIILILTGLQIRFAGLISVVSLKTAVTLHNVVGLVLILNYFVWLLFYLFSDKIVVYHPELDPRKFFRSAFQQMRYYGYGIFAGEPNPHHATAYRKFNALQSLTYQLIMMVLVPIQFYTGLLLWDLHRFSGIVDLLGGVRVVASIHVGLFIFFTAFIFVHVYLASLAPKPSTHFRAMVTGYEETDDPPAKK